MTTGRGEINGAGFPGVFSRLPVCEACLSSSMFLFRLGCGTEAGPRGTRETIHACLYARVRARTRTDIPAIILDTRAPGTKVFVARCFSSFFFFLFSFFPFFPFSNRLPVESSLSIVRVSRERAKFRWSSGEDGFY